jgi:hypothetical protein
LTGLGINEMAVILERESETQFDSQFFQWTGPYRDLAMWAWSGALSGWRWSKESDQQSVLHCRRIFAASDRQSLWLESDNIATNRVKWYMPPNSREN